MPDTVGFPLIVIVLLAHDAVTPLGKPVAVPMPVALVVVWVIDGLNTVFIHNVLVGLLVTVLFGNTAKLLVDVHPVEVSVKVKVTVPTLTPETTPKLVTVATPILLLIQVPPVFGVTFAVLPIHTSLAPPKVGFALIVKLFVAKQPVDVWVNVNVTDPILTPSTKPELVTVATNILLLIQVPPVLGVTLAVLPKHTSFAPPNIGLDGIALIITLVLTGEIHVFAFSTTNVYDPPGGNPLIVILVVFPVVVTPPGVLVIVQFPEGNPLNTTLPVGIVHVGWVIAPTIGAVGGSGSSKHA